MSASVFVCLLMIADVGCIIAMTLSLKIAFGLFRNSGKSALMSNIRKISNSFLELKDRYLTDNKKCKYKY